MKKRDEKEIVRPPKPEVRKQLSDAELSDLREHSEREISEDVKGHIGPKMYPALQSVYQMPRTQNTDALLHDMEIQKLIEEGFADLNNLREQMEIDKLEIQRLKSETRMIISRLLMA